MFYEGRFEVGAVWDRRPAVDRIGAALLRAADYIDEHGWCRYEERDSRGRVCVMGAIHTVTASICDLQDAERRLMGYLGLASPARWNDKWWRTKRQVTRALRAAARRA